MTYMGFRKGNNDTGLAAALDMDWMLRFLKCHKIGYTPPDLPLYNTLLAFACVPVGVTTLSTLRKWEYPEFVPYPGHLRWVPCVARQRDGN